jgi:hypothetical protein
MDETVTAGGPTEHSYATVPGEWSGRYGGTAAEMAFGTWYGMLYNQISTIASLLTEEYQARLVQQAYHQIRAHSHWSAQYCWPEGFMRRWHVAATGEYMVLVTPELVQISTASAQNFVTNIYIGREFDVSGHIPRLGADVPRWYGETIGFWDEDTLITWTSNIQGWNTHSAFEHSSQMQTIEIYSPIHGEDGQFHGLKHEAVFYDPEALVAPVRIVRNLFRASDFTEGDPLPFVACLQTIFPVDGVGTPVSSGNMIETDVLDMYDRPWDQLWKKYLEQDMQRPES